MTQPTTPRQRFEAQLAELVDKFNRHRDRYLSPDYNETEVRVEFIDRFFEALGWDVYNTAGLGKYERDVAREVTEVSGRFDYQFQLQGRARFIVEAKAPHVALDRTDVIMQAKKYAWNSKGSSLVAVTNFEEFRLYDATSRPDPKHPEVGLIFAHQSTAYLQPQVLDDLWSLSRAAVAAGSIEQLLKMSGVKQRERIPVDRAFLDDLTAWRAKLAKAVYKIEPDIGLADLNSVVQVFLDRLIFMRFAEDHGLLPRRELEDVARRWERSGQQRSIVNDLNALFHEVNDLLNGEIFQFHRCEKIDWDQAAALVAKIITGLYDGPYRFDVIGVELLGSIYERYLGKTIRVTATRAVVEDKPEVRKAGGVYYTPQYIVDYIVDQTVGKLIEGQSPEQIAKLKILDLACGSGSFLLGAYQTLLAYHERYYAGQRRAPRGAAPAEARLILDGFPEYDVQLPLAEKAAILRNNIYGVDLDPQAVEITMMSLYIKMLEDERSVVAGRGLLPPLRDNIKCGNSLIGHDLHEPDLLGATLSSEELDRIKPFDWHSPREGFGDIMAAGGFDAVIGNPPYVRMETFKELKNYLKARYACHAERADLYAYLIERAHQLLRPQGRFGMIVSNKFLRASYGQPLREFLRRNAQIERLINLAGLPVFPGATVRTIIVITTRHLPDEHPLLFTPPLFAPPLPIATFEQVANGSLSLEQAVAGSIYAVGAEALAQPIWSFAEGRVEELLNHLQAQSASLAQYCDGQIYMGVKSGLTEAFVIDEATRDAIVKRNKRAAEIIKPFLNGRDVRRYQLEPQPLYLIYTVHGVDIARYPAIEDHLKPFKAALQKRATQQAWYELQQPQANFATFMAGPKIIFPDIAATPRFALDDVGYFSSNTTYFMPKPDRYLLGLLNSRLANFYFVRTCAGLEGKTETYLRFFGQYLEGFPVRLINPAEAADQERHDRLVRMVNWLIDLYRQFKAAASNVTRTRLQRAINITDEKIDALVYQLYGLTDDEIKIVEGR